MQRLEDENQVVGAVGRELAGVRLEEANTAVQTGGGGVAACAGVLALASDDAQRFHAAMGTVYLLRLAELASVAIARFMPAP